MGTVRYYLWNCAKISATSASSFANDWQWVYGNPIVSVAAGAIAGATSADGNVMLIPQHPILNGFAVAAVVFLVTWLIGVLIRMPVVSARLYYAEKRRADVAEQSLADALSPKIRIFINPDVNGVMEIPVSSEAIPGKWVQFSVSCATDAPLVDCEAWLTSVERLDDAGAVQKQLVEERVHCGWSQIDLRKITLKPLLEQRANLFSFDSRLSTPTPEVIPRKFTLQNEIKVPGRYHIKVVVTADNAPSIPATFIFEWRDYNNVTLTQEP